MPRNPVDNYTRTALRDSLDKARKVRRETRSLHLCEADMCVKRTARQFCLDHTPRPADPEFCPMCSGPLGHLGTLGAVTWFSCRNCGAEVSNAD